MLASVVQCEISDFCGFNPHFLSKMGETHANFLVSVFQGCDLCDKMEKQNQFMFALVAASEISDLCGFNPHFLLKKGVTHANFVVSVFQGSDLCDIDGKTDSFHVRLSG